MRRHFNKRNILLILLILALLMTSIGCGNDTNSSNSTQGTYSASDNDSSYGDDITVYITRTGEKYHMEGCQYLRQSQIATSLSDAKANGYTPCSKCDPPQ